MKNDPRKVKKISTKLIHANPWYSVRQDKVKWPNGSRGSYYIVQSSGRGSVIIIPERKNSILTLQQFRYPSNALSTEFPGGMLPRGESLQHCARRELFEETGYRAKSIKKIGTILLNSTLSDYPIHILVAQRLSRVTDPQPEKDELELGAAWVSRDTLSQMIRSGKMRDAAALAAWSLYLST